MQPKKPSSTQGLISEPAENLSLGAGSSEQIQSYSTDPDPNWVDQSEQQAYEYPHWYNLSQILGECEPDLWEFMALEYSHSHAAVRQALVALGSVKEFPAFMKHELT